jgi:carbamoyl-phosphate synthase large subunit
LHQIQQIVDRSKRELARAGGPLPPPIGLLRKAKALGFSDIQIAHLTGSHGRRSGPKTRKALGIRPVYKLVDTCAAEFKAATPYYYSTYEIEDEAR